MIHFSCDRCKKPLGSDDLRYVVRLETSAVLGETEDADLEDDRDHLLEIDEILERMADSQCDAISDDIYRNQRYDLCVACYQRFIQNPLGCEAAVQFEFSDN